MNHFDDLIELGKLSATITDGNQSKPEEIFKSVLDLLNVYFKADWCIGASIKSGQDKHRVLK